MTIVTNTWRQLVQRRLWPVALLLLGALVAVPFLLAKSPEPAAAPAAAPAHRATADAASSEPIVQAISDEESVPTRRVLGVRHDPFQASVRPKRAKTQSSASAADDSPSSPDTAATGGNTPSTSPVAPTTPAAPEEPTITVPANSIDVRFGAATDGGGLTRMTVRRLEALPVGDEPLLVYMGVKDDGKTAIFMVDSSLSATGDGSCKPSVTCEKIELKAGETEFLDVKDDTGAVTGQYELDVIKIHRHATKVPAKSVDSGSSGSAPAATASSRAARRR